MRTSLSLRALPAVTIILAIWPGVAAGSVIVSLNNQGSTTLHEVDVAPGGTFEADLNASADQQFGWVSVAIQASASNVFDVVQVTDSAPWSSQGTVRTMVGDIDPVSGSSAFTFLPGQFGPGLTQVASIQISVDSGALSGLYSIDTTGVLCSMNPPSIEPAPGVAGASFLVHIVPEPSSIAIALVLGLFVSRRRC